MMKDYDGTYWSRMGYKHNIRFVIPVRDWKKDFTIIETPYESIMQPYGRGKKIKGSGAWKKDYHIHEKNRKVKNWWEDMCDFLSRSRMKQIWKKGLSDLQ